MKLVIDLKIQTYGDHNYKTLALGSHVQNMESESGCYSYSLPLPSSHFKKYSTNRYLAVRSSDMVLLPSFNIWEMLKHVEVLTFLGTHLRSEEVSGDLN